VPDHDQHFKRLLQTCFGDLLRIVVPKLAPRLQVDRPTFLHQEQFTDVPEGEHRRLDLVAQVSSIRGNPECVLVHVEVEAKARKAMGLRLFRYAMQLYLRHGRPILPVVLYLRGGKAGVTEEVETIRVLGKTLMTFRYFAFGLSRSQAASYLSRPEPLAWALAALMRRGRSSLAEHRVACLSPIAEVKIDDARRFLLANCVATYVQLDESGWEEYQALLDDERNGKVATMERTLLTNADRAAQQGFEQGREQGIELGIERGREQGREQGRREVLLDLLGRRFGPLPDATLRRLQALRSPEELGRLAERILDARSLDDLGL
jgi:hypothetical protein